VHGKKAAGAWTLLGVAAVSLYAVLASFNFVSCGPALDRPLEETLEQTYPLDATASIHIANEDGSIRVYGGGDELKVQATKKAYSAERLSRIKINIVVRPDSVLITTDYPPKKRWVFSDRSGTVDYIVVVPETARLVRAELANGELAVEGLRGGRVQARLNNGLLFARNCFSDLELTLATGNLSLSFDWWEQAQFTVNGTVTRGNIGSFIPGDAAFHLQAEAPQGKIANDFEEKENRHAEPANKIEMVVGSGGDVRMKIRVNNGNIRIAETNP
jgi:hypothetical protein